MALRKVVFLPLLLGSILLASCDDSSDSSGPSTDPGPPPPTGKMDVLVFSAYCCEGDADIDRKSRLYKVDRLGESSLLSNAPGVGSVIDYAVSPDSARVAYWYSLDSGNSALAIMGLDPVQSEQPAATANIDSAWIVEWRPDSQSLVYSVFDRTNLNSSLFLALLGEEGTHEIVAASSLGAQADVSYDMSRDGSRLAVLINTRGDNQGASTSLYLSDLAAPGELSLIDTGSGGANTFNFNWSDYANELAYQPRILIFPPPDTWLKSNFPAGPLVLMDASGVSRPIFAENEDIPGPYDPYIWLDENRILLTGYGQFAIVGSDGSLFVQQETSSGSAVVPSPDKRRLAYVARAPGSFDHEVYVMDVAGGQSQSVGPASALFLTGNSYDVSYLRWSGDSTMLAWNRRISYEEASVGELYVHDLIESSTRLLSSEHVYNPPGGGFPLFSWPVDENLIEYVAATAEGLELALSDPVTQETQFVGVMAAGFDTPCGYARAWRTKREVLWNHCGDGVYHSQIKPDAAVSSDKLLDGDIYSWNLELTRNGELAVMQRSGPVNDWYMFDFWENRLVEIQVERGSDPPGYVTLLQ